MDPKYDIKQHRERVDEDNFGCSHFGFHQEILPQDNIQIDVFHPRSAIARGLIDYVRKLVLKQKFELKSNCFKILNTF